ncbi:MAG: copper amine oxidase N-terminal domain-containing protein [Candidatus Eremiobacteraeota bacterium]|nr:copper amine oxidase N-terminal domain-containing protein [Candidatus Eremiobacteraeota bacterium]
MQRAAVVGTALAVTASAGLAQSRIETELNGRTLHFDQSPIMQDGRVLVPLRGIFESLGADVLYQPAQRTIKATGSGNTVELTLGSQRATVNGRSVYLDVPADTIAGRTMVPLRFVSEAMGADVRWLPATRTVAIEQSEAPVANQPQPQQPPAQADLEIDSLIHNARGTMRQHDRLTVTMTGDAGGQASFDILGVLNNVPMREISSGRYQGEVTIGPGMVVNQGTLVAHLTRNGQQAVREADRAVTIASTGTLNPPTQDVGMTPSYGSTVSVARPTIRAQFPQQVRPQTIQITVDGRDVTSQASKTSNWVNFVPGYDLQVGSHQVEVQATDRNGQYVHQQWNFYTDNYAYNNTGVPSLSVSNLSDGTTVPAVFNVQGQTSPYTTVKVQATSQRDLVPGVIGLKGRTFTASTVADAQGRFDIQLDTSGLPSKTQLDLTISPVNQSGVTGNPVELELTRR